jgi:hypothetical protein
MASAAAAHELEQRQRLGAAALLGAREPRQAQERRSEARVLVQPAPGHHVLERAHVEEDLQVLERAADARGREPVRRQPRELSILEEHAALAWQVDAGEQVQERRLARAIGPDDGVHHAGRELEAHVLHGVHAAEAPSEVFGAQQQALSPGWGRAPAA